MTLNDNESSTLRDLKAKSDIHDCLIRYYRGVDRLDRDLIMSAFHVDATDTHGVFNGHISDAIDWIIETHSGDLEKHRHHITNEYIELDGDQAHVEHYDLCILRFRNDEGLFDLTVQGRKLDRFECRGGEWRIVDRLALVDSYRTDPVLEDQFPAFLVAGGPFEENMNLGLRTEDDPSYRHFKGSKSGFAKESV